MAKQTRFQQNANTDFFIWLGSNTVPIALLLVLIVGGAIFFLIKNTSTVKEAPTTTLNVKRTDKDVLHHRYARADCDENAYCRQLKRIYVEGGASKEAIRQNLLAADKSLTFQQLQEDPAKYEGTPWAFEGKIVDIVAQEKRGMDDYIVADIIIGGDPAKQLSVRGDFRSDVAENDIVHVVGYLTGRSHPRFGPNREGYGRCPDMSARTFLKPGEANDLLARTGTN
ncbi:MAG TPA: hypothetical protein VFF31_04245 [Blastocatellia bacterium]|nr:hypothetical protein [Blastocatellia bacterium]